MTISFNYQNNEIVSSPTVIVSGRTTTGAQRGVVTFTNNANKVFPPQSFEVNSNGNFKAVVHVSPNEKNQFNVEVADNGYISPLGFAEYQGGKPHIVDTGSLILQFYPLPQNKPIHLCVILGRDSKGTYDMPAYKLQRGEVANLETAIKKLKVAGRLMQAYTQDEMRTFGVSNRSFQFVEETQSHQTIFGYNVSSPTPHQEVKVHVLRSPKTVAELRDPNIAQQNPKATDSGGLFSHALDLIKNTPELFDKVKQGKTAIQCAVLYLDSTWDKKNKLILTHAALGGGNGDIKLAIFGSHGLHSWPSNFPQMVPSFLDGTHLTTDEVANDCNQCGTSWECFNITLGAFMHEIGHLLGCPHQVDGVMLRDYIWWNRSFMTREVECLRQRTSGALINPDGTWPKSCHWNKLDMTRFLFHDSFSLPVDRFQKSIETTQAPDDGNKAPSSYNLPEGGALFKSDVGIYMVEFITDGLARHHHSWFPQVYGGPGPQHELKLDYDQVYAEFRSKSDKAKEDFDVRILSVGGELNISNFKKHCADHDTSGVIKSDFGLSRGVIRGYKSALLGRGKDGDPSFVGFDIKNIYKVRIFHGGALDGVAFYFKNGGGSTQSNNPPPGAPPVPARNYLSKLKDKLNDKVHSANHSGGNGEDKVVVIGNEKPHYSEFILAPGEVITKFHFRNGAWVDAIQFELNNGRKSEMFGKADGGHLSTLEAPGSGYTIVGMYAYVGGWVDGIGILYTNDI
ncbi:zinc metallo proteinase [Scheffersomyces xylosifermentans]|uniref:zinc metallo proteinase n=1 Tax=Scheffersomyces xylosifermentans TaxID=1304137 RepID=UPI00315D66A3